MAQVTQQQRTEVRDHFSQMRNDLDRVLQDAKNVGTKMIGHVTSNPTLGLGLETVQKSIEYNRAIINQTEQAWDAQFAGK